VHLPAPSVDSATNALGLNQHNAFEFEHVPLKPSGWPGTICARLLTLRPLAPTLTLSVAVRGEPD